MRCEVAELTRAEGSPRVNSPRCGISEILRRWACWTAAVARVVAGEDAPLAAMEGPAGLIEEVSEPRGGSDLIRFAGGDIPG